MPMTWKRMGEEPLTERFNTLFEAGTMARLRRQAGIAGVSVSEWVRHTIAEALDRAESEGGE